MDPPCAAAQVPGVLSLNFDEYRALVEHAPVMLWRAGPGGERAYFNATWRAFTGRSSEQEAGSGWAEGIHPEDAAPCLVLYRDGVRRKARFELEYRLRAHDGAYHAVSERIVPYSDASGSVGGFVGATLVRDEVHANEAPYRADDFFEMSLDNLCVAGFDGYFKRLNPSWTKTLGWSAEEFRSKPSIEFVHPDDREATLAGRERLKTGGVLGPLVNRYLCKDGSHRWFEWRSVANVEQRLVYAAARDITEQKLAEERLRQAKELQEKLQRQLIFADRMASVGTLAAGVAHEINNPLAFVSANVTMILEALRALQAERPSSLTAELVEMAKDVGTGAERIRKIVRGLKTFSRAEEERLAIIDAKPVLELAINMTFNEFRHRARLVKEFGDMPLVEADDARLGQVFINLIVNAAHALPEGESNNNEIRIVTCTDAAGRAVIEVRDSGVGIPPSVIERIFDPFFTTKPVGIGTGLGLSICLNIVTGMGGEISVSSVEGLGTTFRVVLPPAPAAPSEDSSRARPPKQADKKASVLVVDDEEFIGIAFRRVLKQHDVTAVVTARSALELLASGKRFDVIFSDLMMPEMSGMDFFDELSARFPEAASRVVFVSGGAFTPAAAAFLERVTNERIEKPFDAETLRNLVRRYAG